MKITRTSQLSGIERTLDLDVTEEQMLRFENRKISGEYIQNIFSNLKASDREFILTGITDDEWYEAFGTDY